ncbi:MAG: Mfa1 family fimbria major subunit [Paramuribaculum sp.]|nr:Mfa1 family fimbria major subunit [Paramuribaculum sp.]
MKKLKAIFGSLLAAALMVGCTDDIDPNSQNENKLKEGDGEGYYMGLDIQMPTGNLSRSTTVEGGGSSDGTEVGSDAENTVTNALIILAEPRTHAFIAAGEVTSSRLTSITTATKASYKAVAKISATALNDYYNELTGDAEPIVEVFVFCNPTKWLVDKAVNWKPEDSEKTEWIDWEALVYQGQGANGQPDYNVGIWSPNSFLMNNVEITTRALPKNILDWELFDKAENPFHLSENNTVKEGLPNNGVAGRGAVKVERSVARFDFKDGSANGDQVYNVLFQADPTDPENEDKKIPIVAVKLQKMCLVNMCNKFYFLPRVSNSGRNGNQGARPTGWELCGVEKPWGRNAEGTYLDGNYVVGPYATQFSALATNWTGSEYSNNPYTYFNFPFFDENGTFNNGTEAKNQWDTYDIATVLKGANDDYTDKKGNKNQYHVWRYVTENIIPAPETNQINPITTGIVFRARLQGTQAALNGEVNEESWEEDVYKNLALCLDGKPFQIRRIDHAAITGVDNNGVSHDPILYYLDGKLYFTWEHMRQAAIQASVTPTWNADSTAILSVEINRSNGIYRAVFGDGPIPAGQKYIKDGKKGQINAFNFTDDRWDADVNSAEYKLYEKSCDYAWAQWVAAGEYVGTLTGGDPEKMKPITAMRKAMTAQNIYIYQSSLDPNQTNPGYYCYYYYWNRHNDNGLAGVMGPMEFDVVRNNVYKLSVDKVNRLGHPRIPENDPDKPTTNTPDESADIYIDVIVEIADWAVRLNSIVF